MIYQSFFIYKKDPRVFVVSKLSYQIMVLLAHIAIEINTAAESEEDGHCCVHKIFVNGIPAH